MKKRTSARIPDFDKCQSAGWELTRSLFRKQTMTFLRSFEKGLRKRFEKKKGDIGINIKAVEFRSPNSSVPSLRFFYKDISLYLKISRTGLELYIFEGGRRIGGSFPTLKMYLDALESWLKQNQHLKQTLN